MSEEVDQHITSKYDIRRRIGKGVGDDQPVCNKTKATFTLPFLLLLLLLLF